MVLERPQRRSLPRRTGAGSAPAGIEKLGDAIRKLPVVVRIVNYEALSRRRQ